MVDFGERGISDAHVSTTCNVSGDCDDADPCTDDFCQQSRACAHTPKDCSSAVDPLDTCNAGSCESGGCVATPANESGACTVGVDPGVCMQGICVKVPRCTLSTSAGCYSFNKTLNSSTSGTGAITDWQCGTGLGGPERAFPLRLTTERTITLRLTSSVDHDLMVLSGTFCTGAAACVAKSMTPGSGMETITFTAQANTDYVVVVDAKAGVTGSFTLEVLCGDCAGTPTLACNMTYAGDTSRASAKKIFGGYSCQTGEVGPEEAWTIPPQAAETNFKLTLKGLTQDQDLFVLGADSLQQCDPTWCRGQSITTGNVDEVVNLTATANTNYWVVVDSKGATGAPYSLEVACPPSCRNTSNSLSCGAPSDSRRNDDPGRSRGLVDSWSCDPNTTGPEVVYYVYASTAGQYTVELTGTTADLDLIVVEGTFSACDPTAPCVASGTTVGSGNETVTWMAKAATYYWIAVDGKNGAVSPYQLKLRASTCPAPSCYQSLNRLSCTYLEEERRSDDPTRGRNAIDAWACDTNTTGPEMVYQFRPPMSGSYTVTVDGLTADLDLIVLSSTSSVTCDSASACVGQSTNPGTMDESVTFTADSTKYYYFAVDGKNGAVSPFHIKLTSALCPAPVCVNGFRPLSCPISSRSVSNINDATNSTSDITSWPCTGALNLNGPEFLHQFTPTGPGPYTVEMIGLQDNLDLIVMENTATGTCDPATMCVAATAAGTTSEKITFTADPAKRYWFVVDGRDGAISPYTLAVTAGCP